MTTPLQPAFVTLAPGEELLCYNQGNLKQLNPNWDGTVPQSNWGLFWQGFRERAKYIDHIDIELMFGLTNQRLFVEPKDWGWLLSTALHVFAKLAPVHPAVQNKVEAGLEEQEKLVTQARNSGQPLVSLPHDQIRRVTIDPDEYTYVVEYLIEGEEGVLYFMVNDNRECWETHFHVSRAGAETEYPQGEKNIS